MTENKREIRQREREGLDWLEGEARYLKQVRHSPLHGGAALDVIQEAVLALVDKIEQEGERLKMGSTSRTVGMVLRRLDSDALALVTVHVAAQSVLRAPRQAEQNIPQNLQAVATQLGEAIVKNLAVERLPGGGFRWVFGKEIVPWTEHENIEFAAGLLHMLAETKKFIAIEKIKGSRLFHVMLLEKVSDWIASEDNRKAILLPQRSPMICPPCRWDESLKGGYLTPALRQELVRGHVKLKLSKKEQRELARTPHIQTGLNLLQATPWKINREILAKARGEFPGLSKHQRDELRKIEGLSALQKYIREKLQVDVANDLADELTIYFAYRPDFRGRLYPESDALNPDFGGDLSRGLLQFANAEPLGKDGKHWLAIHVGNCYGKNECGKESTLIEREQWTIANGHNLLSFFGKEDEEGKAKDRWQFLAAALEWARLLAHEAAGNPATTFESAIPVRLDGRANGVQHYAALTRSADEGMLVGILPSERPSDLYTFFARQLSLKFPGNSHMEYFANRPVIKSVLQPWFFGSTIRVQISGSDKEPPNSTLRAIYSKMEQDGLGVTKSVKSLLVTAVEGLVKKHLSATTKLKNWLRSNSYREGVKRVQWSTPSGWIVYHRPTKRGEITELEYTVNGVRHRARLATGWVPDNSEIGKGMAPNVIHSLDAAHLTMTIALAHERGVNAFATVHDSFGTHAGKVDVLRDSLREVFASPAFADGAQVTLDALSKDSGKPRLPIGKLDLEQVTRSDYFFD